MNRPTPTVASDFTISDFRPSLSRRFWGLVPIGRADECWPWAGSRNSNGYPLLSDGGSKSLVATRLMRGFIDGKPVPPQLLVCHSCDNPSCVNPSHLWVGTHQDNSRDMIAKGRRGDRRRATHCRRGHEFTPENTMAERGDVRRCRTCRSRRNKHQPESVK